MLRNFESYFRQADVNNDDFLDKQEFFSALDSMSLQLTKAEKETVFRLADIDGDNLVRLQEFFDFMNTYEIAKPIENRESIVPSKRTSSRKKTSKLSKALTKNTALSLKNILHVEVEDQERADLAFEHFMRKIKIHEEDYTFPGKTTILNDELKCLRRCYDIIKELEASGQARWNDPEFGPQDPDNPEDHGKDSIYFDEPLPGYPDPDLISWCRAKDIALNGKPEFLSDNAKSNDVIQGELGDCWFIGALSVLATRDSYIRGSFEPTNETLKEISDEEAQGMRDGLYPPMFHFMRQYGVYVIRFFKNYAWRYVIIDDRLPCYKYEGDETKPDLVFGKCRDLNEFWVPLIEKAYAKLHNCYESLIAGYLDDGLTDMTGLVSHKYKLHGPKGFPHPSIGSAEELWQKLMEFRKNNTMMGCSVQGEPGETEHEVMIDDEPVGILKNHAYAIIDVLEIPNPEARNSHKSHRLLRLRNPWGRKEWNGKWSDGNVKLLENLQQ